MQTIFRFTALLLFLSCSTTKAKAQSPDPSSYFPLETGNQWTLFEVLFPPNAPPDTLWGGTYTLVDQTVVNDTSYHVFDHGIVFADTVRSELDGKFFGRINGKDRLLFDFGLAENESFQFPTGFGTDEYYTVTIERGISLDVGAGHFDDCVVVNFDVAAIDGDRSYWFAPGVGLVMQIYGPGIYGELYEATVSGAIVSSIEQGPHEVHPTVEAGAYPNPFSSVATFRVPSQTVRQPTAQIFDVLGRLVATLHAESCSGTECTFQWDGTGMQNGHYFFRTVGNPPIATTSILLLK